MATHTRHRTTAWWAMAGLAVLLLAGAPSAEGAKLNGLAGPTGGLYYQYMAGLSKIVHDVYPDLEINLSPGGAVANIVRISRDATALGTTTLLQSVQAMRATDDFEGKPPVTNLRVLLSLPDPSYFYPLFRPEVPITNLEDIKTKKLKLRLGMVPRGSISEWGWRKLLEFSGISPKDIESFGGKISFTNFSDMVNLMKDGHLDGMLGVGTAKAGWLVDLTNSRQIHFVPFHEPAVERFVKEYGGSGWSELPANNFKGQEKPYKLFRTYPTTLIVTNESLPEETGYKIVKAVMDNLEKFKLTNAEGLKDLSLANAWKAGTFQLHKGAARYFTEKGAMK
ncbi:MAG: TAXI family TRAP transporter solute-binding subunit [Candidatus Methylomirabilota bacterium]